MKNKKRLLHFLSLFMYFLCLSTLGYADGSKDLYPLNAKGGRARLLASTDPGANLQYATLGSHYVFAKAGETIALASSAMGLNCSEIRLTSPLGVVSAYNGFYAGYIANRNAELAGPSLPGAQDAKNGRYKPVYYVVKNGEDGVFKVEFVSTAGESSVANDKNTEDADMNWIQSGQSAFIAAWDISVSNSSNTAWIPGRVYTTVLNLSTGTDSTEKKIRGLFYVLTNDGYTYKISNPSGTLTFFANNKGFIDANGNPLYKSLKGATASFLKDKMQDPRTEDTGSAITHKIFYTLPDAGMPDYAAAATGRTWLKNPMASPIKATIKGIYLVGKEGTAEQMSKKGAFINFESDIAEKFIITISSKAPSGSQFYFPARSIIVDSEVGPNQVFWDAKDGEGNFLSAGDIPIVLSIQLQKKTGEIHLPFVNRAENSDGILVQLLSSDLATVQSDLIYWDDADLPQAAAGNPDPVKAAHTVLPKGIASAVNGHRWSASDFGSGNAIDTWAFQTSIESRESILLVREADLKIQSITAASDLMEAGQEANYTVVVKNEGPTEAKGATFAFNVPEGFEVKNVTMNADCTTQNQNLSADNQHYKGAIDLASGCVATYLVTIIPSSPKFLGSVKVEAAILRPNDVTDADEDLRPQTQSNNVQSYESVIYKDRLVPTLSQVNIIADHNVPTLAKVGNTATLTFTSSEELQTPVVTIGGHTVTPTAAGNNWTASYTFATSDSEGNVAFSIAFSDVAGNEGTVVTTTTNGSGVMFDKTPPTLTITSDAGIYGSTTTASIVNFTVKFSEPVTGFTLAGITPTNGAVSTFEGNGDTYTLKMAPIVAGNSGITVAANTVQDIAGNSNMATTPFTVLYAPIPVIASTGSLMPFTAVYGTVSAPQHINVSGMHISDGITVTAGSAAFEVSIDGRSYGSSAMLTGSGNISGTVYLRIKSTAPAGIYALANVVLTSPAATTQNFNIPSCEVMPAPLTIMASDVSKTYGLALAGGGGSTAFTQTGLVGPETIGSVTIAYGTGAGANDNAGTYTMQVTPSEAVGGTFNPSNYIIAYTKGNIIVAKATPAITFGLLTTQTYGNADLDPDANSNNITTPISYESSNTAVATIVAGKIHLVGAGTSTITASQAGNANYSAAPAVAQTLIVNKATQAIAFGAVADKLSTDAPFALGATSTSGLTVNYASSEVGVARIINGNQIEILKEGTVTITASQAGNGNYTAAVPVVQSLRIINNPVPVIAITSDKGSDISKGQTARLTATGAVTYQWSTANGIIAGQSEAVLTVRPSVTTIYIVTGANQYGRTSTQSFALEVKDDLQAVEATNILTPNGDGVNDKWMVENIDQYPNNEVKIFDKAGRILYSKKGYDNSWDATLNGAPLSEGTYFYIIDFGPGRLKKKGFITIVRQSR